RTGKPVAPPFPLDGWGWSALITPDGHYAVVAGGAAVLRAFNVDDLDKPDYPNVDDLCLIGELLSGQRLHEGSDVAALTTDEWLERWRACPGPVPPVEELEPPDAIAWHRRRADVLATTQRWRAVHWHLDRLIAADPTTLQPYLDRARVHLALAEREEAIVDFTKLIDGGAGGWQVRLERGQTFAALHLWDKA